MDFLKIFLTANQTHRSFLQLGATFALHPATTTHVLSRTPLQTACAAAGGRRAAPAGDGGEAQGGDSREASMDEGAGQGAQRKEGGGATANTGRKKRTALQVNVCKG